MLRAFLLVLAFGGILLTAAGCSTPQERSGYNTKPFNSPAGWELQPYGSFQN